MCGLHAFVCVRHRNSALSHFLTYYFLPWSCCLIPLTISLPVFSPYYARLSTLHWSSLKGRHLTQLLFSSLVMRTTPECSVSVWCQRSDKVSTHTHTLSLFHTHSLSLSLSLFPQSLVSKGLQADQWVQAVTEVTGGKGGGTATTAQASGPNLDQLPQAMAAARQYATSKLQWYNLQDHQWTNQLGLLLLLFNTL